MKTPTFHLTTTLTLGELRHTVTTEGDPFSDEIDNVRDEWLDRHSDAIRGLSQYKIDKEKIVL